VFCFWIKQLNLGYLFQNGLSVTKLNITNQRPRGLGRKY